MRSPGTLCYLETVSMQHFYCLGSMCWGLLYWSQSRGHCLGLGLDLTVLVLLSRDQDSSRHLTSEETHDLIDKLVCMMLLNVWTDLSDSCVLAAIDDNLSSNYASDMFSNSDNYPTLSHSLSPQSAPQPSPAMQQPHPPSTVHCQASTDCHAAITSAQHPPPTISAQQRHSLHALGKIKCLWKI